MASVDETHHADHVGHQHDHDSALAEKTQAMSIRGSRPPTIANGSIRESTYQGEHAHDGAEEHEDRPQLQSRASRSYVKPIAIVTTYEPELVDENLLNRRKSVASTFGEQGGAANGVPSLAPHIQQRPGSRAGSIKAPSTKAATIKAPSTRAPSVKAPSIRDASRAPSIREASRAPSRAASVRNSTIAGSQMNGVNSNAPYGNNGHNGSNGPANVGEVMSHERQRELQHQQQQQQLNGNGQHRISLVDGGALQRDDSQRSLTMGSQRPRSQFGHRPEPLLAGIDEEGDNGRWNEPQSRAALLGRNGTVISRSGTLGRNGTMSRAANGGTVGTRRGAFGRGAGASIGTQPEEVLGRDDIHARAELSERILGEATLRRLATMERKDASKIAKVIKTEGKAEAKAVAGSIKELERLVKLQKEAASAERKSQLRLTKHTGKEHKARLRFLKEKERYERVEGELRNAENDYEERRDHAAGLTAQVAERTQELDDLRALKAADDREREVKLLALKNPAHS